MLVIHPEDRTTTMLTTLYEGVPGATVWRKRAGSGEVRSLLHQVFPQEQIMLLGHGCDKGLYTRADDEQGLVFDSLLVSHRHAWHLRRHGANLVGIWCHAVEFARSENLHGLFSGMLITEAAEAELYGVPTSEEELALENDRLFRRLRSLLDADVPLPEIPERLRAMDTVRSPLTVFNYERFYYL